MSTLPGPPLLFCFHHAGAGVSAFARWQERFGAALEVVPVLLPGRDARVRERRITDRDALLDELERLTARADDRPYLLYGHSLGGLVAYTLAAAREAAGRPARALVIGAALPPHLRSSLAGGAELPDDRLLQLLVHLGVLPREAALEPESGGIWRRRVLPPLRDDLRLARDLIRSAGTALHTPVLALAGHSDPVAPPAGMDQWARYASGDFRRRTVQGGHLFVRDKALPAVIRREVGAVLRDLRPESSAV
ncbi:thioesterase II family protein [Streptomyces sp. NPDC050421]|uniref:thioesterase II family protein n=1 Tax=unclassified Streptomyces TaxID=2593676 RepID=UPI00379FD84A